MDIELLIRDYQQILLTHAISAESLAVVCTGSKKPYNSTSLQKHFDESLMRRNLLFSGSVGATPFAVNRYPHFASSSRAAHQIALWRSRNQFEYCLDVK